MHTLSQKKTATSYSSPKDTQPCIRLFSCQDKDIHSILYPKKKDANQALHNTHRKRRQTPKEDQHKLNPTAELLPSTPGEPITPGIRSFFEPRFGYDFSHVRVHTDARAAAAAESIDVEAYTIRRNIVFGRGKSPQKDSLTALELSHVVQQTGLPQQRIQRRPIRRGPNEWLLNEIPVGTVYTDFLQTVFRECCWITTCRSDGGAFLDDLLENHSNLEQIHTWISDEPRNRNHNDPVFVRYPAQFHNVPLNEIQTVNLHLRTHLNEGESAIGALQFTVIRRRLVHERLPCTRDRTLDVFAVHLPGAARSVQDDIRHANGILCQCGIALNLAGSRNWSTNLLDRTPPRNTLNFYGRERAAAETRKMLEYRPGGNMIHIYYVPIITLRHTAGYAFNTEGSEPYSETAINSVLIVNRTGPDTLAHEIGHVLLDDFHHDFSTNLMAEGPVRAGTNVLLRPQCRIMQGFRMR